MDEVAIRQRALVDAADRDTVLAWTMVAIEAKARHDKRLPPLQSLLRHRTETTPRQQGRAMRERLMQWAEAHNAAIARQRAH